MTLWKRFQKNAMINLFEKKLEIMEKILIKKPRPKGHGLLYSVILKDKIEFISLSFSLFFNT